MHTPLTLKTIKGNQKVLPWLIPPPPCEVDVAAIRAACGRGQSTFASLCGVSVRTLQGWEQGRRKPTGAARALLMVIQHDIDAYMHATQAAIDAAEGQ
jgi:DNA-binding XRE family transcriptional regulator